jgi:hypothetical protein
MWGISNSILFGLLLVIYQVISTLLAVIFISLLILFLIVIFMWVTGMLQGVLVSCFK